MTALAPWAAHDLDPERVARELRCRFPRASVWWGEFTGSWWALTRDPSGRDRLVEARDPFELGRRLEMVRPARPSRPVEPGRTPQPRSTEGGQSFRPAAPAGRSARRPLPAPCVAPVRGRAREGWWRRVLRSLVVIE